MLKLLSLIVFYALPLTDSDLATKRECQLTNQPNLQGDAESEIYLPGLSPAPSV